MDLQEVKTVGWVKTEANIVDYNFVSFCNYILQLKQIS